MTTAERKLMYRATAMLSQKGFRWDGRPKEKVCGYQVVFEKSMRPNPFSGRSTRKR